MVRGLLERGLIVSDSSDSALTDLRERDEALTAAAWHPDATLYHFATQWSGVDIRDGDGGDAELAAQTAAAVQDLVAEHGPHPPSSRT